ncbi:MAG: 50S ribosomal protein L23 [Armatimonadota bacterium]|nr:50S ribosomal protein L23 [Armatimonadota bacterium]MDR7443052.1 50S ribosomal protein L23 [Armatimonadota bacterium]MDR7614494.1 50S ribosomal protein L23 [Armatimonadota bacterium]
MRDPREILRRPILTEKSMRGVELGKYTFEVARDATKPEIREAVERIFGVKVAKVNTLRIPGKTRRRGPHVYRTPDRKKAIVTLQAGYKIDLEQFA